MDSELGQGTYAFEIKIWTLFQSKLGLTLQPYILYTLKCIPENTKSFRIMVIIANQDTGLFLFPETKINK